MNNDFSPPADPWSLFGQWYALAGEKESAYPNAMALATVGKDGMPTVRTVLMKHWDTRGIVFHTNRESRKGRDLAAHPKAGVCFYWKSLERQIRIEGPVSLLDDAASDAYFASRPRDSQIGAWASLQSRPYDIRATFEKRIVESEARYAGRDVPRPPHWGGYRIAPVSFEFWQERTFRLHDRIAYTRGSVGGDAGWTIERLYP